MKKCLGLISSIILLSSVFGISYVDDTEAKSTGAEGSGAAVVNDPEITGAQSPFWFDVRERVGKGVKEKTEVLLQLVLRDKNGNLLAYVETTEKLRLRPAFFYTFLMEQGNKNYVMIDNKPFEVIHWPGNESPARKSHYSMAMYVLIHKVPDFGRQNLVVMNHEAYQVQPGDRLEVYWTAYLPINP